MRLLANSILEMGYAPEIREPTLTSVVGCMRGCGKGCEFCAPILRKKRDFPRKGSQGRQVSTPCTAKERCGSRPGS